MPHAGVDVCGDPAERGVAGAVGGIRRDWVLDAPVGPAGAVGELGATFASLVAQGDHAVEPAADQGAEIPGLLVSDVDAELVAQDAHCVGVQVRLRAGARAGHAHAVPGVVTHQRLSDR
jgi:hypothetical protein